MTLRELRDRLTLAQVVLACAAVALGGGLSAPSMALAGALALLAFVRPLPDKASVQSQRLWTLLIFAGLVASFARVAFRQEILDAGVDFLLLLVVQRLFNRQKSREHMQLLLLGALLMIVGAVINTDLSYPALLAGYMVVTVMALIINHLVSEGERLGPRVAFEVAREGPRRVALLWRAAASVAGLAALGGLVVFIIFPRVGVGFFLRGQMADQVLSGFSSEVQLGQFGTIKTDPTPVMRLEPITPLPQTDRVVWHLRGSAYELYSGGRWLRSPEAERVPTDRKAGFKSFVQDDVFDVETTEDPSGAGLTITPRLIPGFAASGRKLHVKVTLEDIGADVVFTASEPVGARLLKRGEYERYRLKLLPGVNREFRVSKPPGPIQYEFVSRIGEPTNDELARVGDPVVPDRLRIYLTPGANLSGEFHQLVADLTRRSTTRLDRVQAVMGHLSTYRYTLALEPSSRVQAGADPIEGFLFETKAGHCEYFASATALMLRDAGVPTRLVNGYYGAHYNGVGEFYTVRQADAHSWVEVHFGPLGWITFDPTPPAGRTAGDDAPVWPAMAEVLDALRNSYLNYVVDYNLGKQLALLEGLGVRSNNSSPRKVSLRLAAFVAIPLALGFAWVSLRRRRRPPERPESVVYRKLLERLERQGLERMPHESCHRFAVRITEQGTPQGPALGRFGQAYEAVRFGPNASPAQVQHLQELADKVDESPG